MKYKLHIPYASRTDLLKQAVESVREIGNIHLWADACPRADIDGVTHHEMPELGPVAMMNTMLKCSLDDNDDVIFLMHNDAYCLPGGAQIMLARAYEQFHKGGKWGVMFSLYDVFMCMNPAAVRDVGWWDVRYFQYKADNDFYYRLKLNGWEVLGYNRDDVWLKDRPQYPQSPVQGALIHEGYKVIHHGSATIKSDNLFRIKTRIFEAALEQYYNAKWGGPPDKERFVRPFENRVPGSNIPNIVPRQGVKA